tara:strand:+ start:2682 stop:3296 length:615 start_codon:yes stop_codon:yes gene_type:complete
MKIYLDKKSFYNLENLKHRHKCLENIEIKDFETALVNLVSTDLENIYCQQTQKETLNFYLRSPQQISYLAKQISEDFNNHGATLRLSLSELMMNSLEHGNLRIDSLTKNQMMLDGSYYDLLENLIDSNKFKHIEVEYKLDAPKRIVIKDKGDGFDFEEYLARMNMAENDEYSGRGLQIAKEELPKNQAKFAYLDEGKTLVIDFA